MADEKIPELGQTEAAAEKAAKEPLTADQRFRKTIRDQFISAAERFKQGWRQGLLEQGSGDPGVFAPRSQNYVLKGSDNVYTDLTNISSKEQLQRIPRIEHVPNIYLSFTRIHTSLGSEVDRVLQKSQDETVTAITKTYEVLKDRVFTIQKSITILDRNVKLVDTRTRAFQSDTQQVLDTLKGRLKRLESGQDDWGQKFKKIDIPEKKADATKAEKDGYDFDLSDAAITGWFLKKFGLGLGTLSSLFSAGVVFAAIEAAKHYDKRTGTFYVADPKVKAELDELRKNQTDWYAWFTGQQPRPGFKGGPPPGQPPSGPPQKKDQLGGSISDETKIGVVVGTAASFIGAKLIHALGLFGIKGAAATKAAALVAQTSGSAGAISAGQVSTIATSTGISVMALAGALATVGIVMTGISEGVLGDVGLHGKPREKPGAVGRDAARQWESIKKFFGMSAEAAETVPEKQQVQQTEVKLTAQETILLKGTKSVLIQAPTITIEASDIIFKGRVSGLPEASRSEFPKQQPDRESPYRVGERGLTPQQHRTVTQFIGPTQSGLQDAWKRSVGPERGGTYKEPGMAKYGIAPHSAAPVSGGALSSITGNIGEYLKGIIGVGEYIAPGGGQFAGTGTTGEWAPQEETGIELARGEIERRESSVMFGPNAPGIPETPGIWGMIGNVAGSLQSGAAALGARLGSWLGFGGGTTTGSGGGGSGGGGGVGAIEAPPELSAADKATWNKLVSEGKLSGSDPQARAIFDKLSPEQLAQIGVTKTGGPGGRSQYIFTPPTLSSAEAKQRILEESGRVVGAQGTQKVSGATLDNIVTALMKGDPKLGIKGMTKEEATIMAANFYQEGGFSMGAVGDRGTVPGGSHGLAQWNRERWNQGPNSLQAKAAEWGMDYRTHETQVKFAMWEMQQGGYQSFWKQYQAAVAAGDTEKAYALVRDKYEVGIHNRSAFHEGLRLLAGQKAVPTRQPGEVTEQEIAAYQEQYKKTYGKTIEPKLAAMLAATGGNIAVASLKLGNAPQNAILASMMTGEIGGQVGDPRSAYKGRRAGTHQGIDIFAEQGTPIYAPADGVVVRSYTSSGAAGNAINIKVRGEDGKEYEIRTYHMSGWGEGVGPDDLRKAGGRIGIKKGQIIGYVGKTGAGGEPLPGKTPPHQHLEVYQDGRRVDPNLVFGWGPERGTRGKQIVAGGYYTGGELLSQPETQVAQAEATPTESKYPAAPELGPQPDINKPYKPTSTPEISSVSQVSKVSSSIISEAQAAERVTGLPPGVTQAEADKRNEQGIGPAQGWAPDEKGRWRKSTQITPAVEVTATKKPDVDLTPREKQRETGHYPGAGATEPTRGEKQRGAGTYPGSAGQKKEPSNPQSDKFTKGKEAATTTKENTKHQSQDSPSTGGIRGSGGGGGGTSPDHCHFCDEV